MPANRPGRLSKEDQKWILENAGHIDVDDMAVKLGKTAEMLHRFLREHRGPAGTEDKITIRDDLRNSEEWKRLKAEFTGDELKLFEEKYIGFMSQFKGDVLASEETQIMQAVKFIILMSRNLAARSKALADVGRLEDALEAHLASFGGQRVNMDSVAKATALGMETQLQTARASERAHTTEYVKFQERYDNIMTGLKATREQRAKDIQSSKVNFLGLVKMLQQKDLQDREGRTMELMRKAADKEYNRLGQLHQYEDGELDRPILSPQTLDLE